MTVRPATPEDEDALYDLLMSMHREIQLGLPYRPEVVLAGIRSGTRPGSDNQMHAFIGVIDGEKEIIGSVGLFLGQAAWFVDDIWWLFERWMYVRPTDPERAKHSAELFAYALKTRDDMRERLGPDYPWPFEVIMSWTSGDRQEARDRLWSRYGEKVGSSFILR